jgi:hypothetical protein
MASAARCVNSRHPGILKLRTTRRTAGSEAKRRKALNFLPPSSVDWHGCCTVCNRQNSLDEGRLQTAGKGYA